MMEKPLAVSMEHARAIAKAAEPAKIPVLVNYETTWYASNRAAYALATSVLVGMQPVFTQVPPNSLRSTIATVMPARVNRPARDGPAWPAPMW